MRLPLPRLRSGSIPHEDARDVVRWVRYWRPMEISSDDVAGYRHPWQVALRWSVASDQWEAYIARDSYVGGPVAREVETPPLPWRALPAVTRERFGDRNPGRPVRPWVSEGPPLPLPATLWRRLGKDAPPTLEGAGERIPQPLLDLGAGTGEEIRIDREEMSVTILRGASTVDRSRLRLVRALDVVLSVARPRVRISSTTAGELEITLDLPADAAPSVRPQRARYEPELPAESVLDQFLRMMGDTGLDSLLVARIYLLSRPGAPDGARLDASWTPHVQQGLFWNPQHRSTYERNAVDPLRLTFPTGLASGVGDAAVQAVLADINERDALASLLVSEASVTGQFFT